MKTMSAFHALYRILKHKICIANVKKALLRSFATSQHIFFMKNIFPNNLTFHVSALFVWKIQTLNPDKLLHNLQLLHYYDHLHLYFSLFFNQANQHKLFMPKKQFSIVVWNWNEIDFFSKNTNDDLTMELCDAKLELEKWARKIKLEKSYSTSTVNTWLRCENAMLCDINMWIGLIYDLFH
jgi:hypothetical protein